MAFTLSPPLRFVRAAACGISTHMDFASAAAGCGCTPFPAIFMCVYPAPTGVALVYEVAVDGSQWVQLAEGHRRSYALMSAHLSMRAGPHCTKKGGTNA